MAKEKEENVVNMVEVLLPESDLEPSMHYVAVNGEGYYIRRGEPTMVPDYIAAVLKQQQIDATAARKNRERARKRSNL